MQYYKLIPILNFLLHTVDCGYLELPLVKRTEKEGTSDVNIFNRGSFIGIKAKVGSPSQEVELLLDTGSSDSWIMSSENPYCAGPIVSGNSKEMSLVDIGGILQSKTPIKLNSQPCSNYGVFDRKLSGSYNETDEKFFVKYFDTTSVDGVWSSDSFSIGDHYNLTEFDFGIGLSSNSSVGILGLGIPDFKVMDGKVQYERDNFVMKLNKDGFISRKVFSIWLNHKDNDAGKILFGAVDHAKLEPPLVTMKMINTEDPGHPIKRYELMLTDITFQGSKDSKEVSLFDESETYSGSYPGSLIDSGSMFSYFPEELFNGFIELFNYVEIEGTDQYLVECVDEEGDDDMKISFKFSTTKFNIPLRNFLLPKPTSYNKYVTNGKEYCLLSIMPQHSNYTILGQSFMRSLYTVFDIDKMEISMAPVVYTDKSEIEEISIQHSFNSTRDGDVAEELRLDFYDPQVDFVPDNSNGYYKQLNKAGRSHILDNCYIAKVLVIIAAVLVVV